MRRILAAVCILLATIGVAPNSAAADPESTTVSRFKGQLGAVSLTDCPVVAPAGFKCRAVAVLAFERRLYADGQNSGPAVEVSLFDVTALDGEPAFSVELIGLGDTEDAEVKINGLSKGTASAQNIQLTCQFGPCGSGVPESISVAVEWAGFGPTTSFKSHDKFSDPFCSSNSRTRRSFRSADATGTVDGWSFAGPVSDNFGALLQSDSSGTVQRCKFS